MTIIKYFYRKGTLKRKIFDIKDDIIKLVNKHCAENFFITWYGAYFIDPKNLVYWVCVKTDKTKSKLRDNDELNIQLRQLLIKHEYPTNAQKDIYFNFESQETVDRESKGNWYFHFK